ncbi:MAG: isochorismatase family protein [Chloroflexi bacterium]|nr:MAG: isochorismatase family protein [Chloroflexota bacterium]
MVDYGPDVALIVVDVQNDFADPKGSLHVEGGEDVVPVANREIDRARAAGSLVFYTQDWHPASTPHFQKDGGIWPVHCVAGSWGAELHPKLKVQGEVIRKGIGGEDGYSGFTVRDVRSGDERATELGSRLRDTGVRHVVVLGLATDYCVGATARDATEAGWDTTVLKEAIRAVDLHPGDGDRMLSDLVATGVHLN